MTLPASLVAQVSALGIDPNAPDLGARIEAELRRRCTRQLERRKQFNKLARAFPMATSVLWRAQQAPCDQRRSVLEAMWAPVVTLVLGGERSGKSLGLKQLTIAMALGGDHPVVRAWLELNGLPRDRIPNGPAEVYAVALTSNDSVRYHRPSFDEMLGQLPHSWYNKTGNGESRLVFDVPGYNKQGIIHFKSVDQGARSFQGISLRWAWIDEEPLGTDGKEVYRQCRARVMDQDGRIGISMVPMNGYTWVHDDLIRDKQDKAVHVELDALDNPHLPENRASAHYNSFTGDELAMRRYGRFRSTAGAIYPLWNAGGSGERASSGHVCEDFEIPSDWPRYTGGDFGLHNPTAIVWGAIGDDGTLYIYREYYQADGLLLGGYPYHATKARELMLRHDGSYEPIASGWADPSAPDAINTFANHGLYFNRANNDHKIGYSSVNERLRLRDGHRPRIKVFRSCPNTIRELGGLIRDPKRIDVEQIKKDDHAADAVRYLCVGLDEWYGLGL